MAWQNPTYNHTEMKQKVGVANLKLFDGEDLTAGDRKRLQQLQMQDWIKQQIKDKEDLKNKEKSDKAAWDRQIIENNNTRKQLEVEQQRRRTEMEINNTQTNLQFVLSIQNIFNQLKEKVDREDQQTQQATKEKLEFAKFVQTNDVFTEKFQIILKTQYLSPATSQSALAPHRVIPYHYKGMSDEQRKGIRNDQQQQREQKQEDKRIQQEEQQIWAQYNEVIISKNNRNNQHNRQMVVDLEKEKANKLKDTMQKTKEFNVVAGRDQKIRIKNQYA